MKLAIATLALCIVAASASGQPAPSPPAPVLDPMNENAALGGELLECTQARVRWHAWANQFQAELAKAKAVIASEPPKTEPKP